MSLLLLPFIFPSAETLHFRSEGQAIPPFTAIRNTMGLFGGSLLPELDDGPDDDVRVIRDRRGRLAVSRPSGRPRIKVRSFESGCAHYGHHDSIWETNSTLTTFSF